MIKKTLVILLLCIITINYTYKPVEVQAVVGVDDWLAVTIVMIVLSWGAVQCESGNFPKLAWDIVRQMPLAMKNYYNNFDVAIDKLTGSDIKWIMDKATGLNADTTQYIPTYALGEPIPYTQLTNVSFVDTLPKWINL